MSFDSLIEGGLSTLSKYTSSPFASSGLMSPDGFADADFSSSVYPLLSFGLTFAIAVCVIKSIVLVLTSSRFITTPNDKGKIAN